MRINIITAFPELIASFKTHSIVKNALEKDLIELNIIDLRDSAEDKRKTIDDKPFGGGAGMLLKVNTLYSALKSIGAINRGKDHLVILTSANGQIWEQNMAWEYSKNISELTIICGHYEGIDARVENFIDAKISIGKYVLTGGEIPAMIISDSIVRLIPGVVGNPDSIVDESHSDDMLGEYPQYTRPASFKTDKGDVLEVPEVLVSGNHKLIEEWKKANSTPKE